MFIILGGLPGVEKTTIAQKLAQAIGLLIYNTAGESAHFLYNK